MIPSVDSAPSRLRIGTPLIFGVLVLVAGIFAAEYWQLYRRITELDSIFHVLGGIAVGWMGLVLLQTDFKMLSGLKQCVIIVSVTALVGVLWEFAEYVAGFGKNAFPLLYHYFHGGGLADTLADLAADLVGGIGVALVSLRRR